MTLSNSRKGHWVQILCSKEILNNWNVCCTVWLFFKHVMILNTLESIAIYHGMKRIRIKYGHYRRVVMHAVHCITVNLSFKFVILQLKDKRLTF